MIFTFVGESAVLGGDTPDMICNLLFIFFVEKIKNETGKFFFLLSHLIRKIGGHQLRLSGLINITTAIILSSSTC
jgi:hypothetical protein